MSDKSKKIWKYIGIYALVGGIIYLLILWYNYSKCKNKNPQNDCKFFSFTGYGKTSTSGNRGVQQRCPEGQHYEVKNNQSVCVPNAIAY